MLCDDDDDAEVVQCIVTSRSRRKAVTRVVRELYVRHGIASSFITALHNHAKKYCIGDKQLNVAMLSVEALKKARPLLDEAPKDIQIVVALTRSVAERAIAEAVEAPERARLTSLWRKAIRRVESKETSNGFTVFAIEDIFDKDLRCPRDACDTAEEASIQSLTHIRTAMMSQLDNTLVQLHITSDIVAFARHQSSCDELERIQLIVSEDSVNEPHAFQPYWSDERVVDEVKLKTAIRGKLHIKSNGDVGVLQRTDACPVRIDGCKALNRALHGDIVCVQIIDREAAQHNDAHTDVFNDDVDDVDEHDDDVCIGRVVAVLQRCQREFIATLQHCDENDERYHDQALMIPADRRAPKIRVRTNSMQSLHHQRILVRIDSWCYQHKYPKGHIVEVIGEAGELDVETRALLLSNGINQCEYGAEEFADCLRGAFKFISGELSDEDLVEGRRDLRRSHIICSIDPPRCTDIDDALSLCVNDSSVELGVHIADVCAFLERESPLDKEALRRGTTVYLEDRRINMLPSILSEQACSLRADVDRFAVSVIVCFARDKHGNIDVNNSENIWFGRTLIKSTAALAYDEAQALADTSESCGNQRDSLRTSLQWLQRIGRLLRKRRQERGALEVESFQTSFDIGATASVNGDDKHTSIKVTQEHHVEFHDTVAELMIFANALVAKRIHSFSQAHAVLRRHTKPAADSLHAVRTMLALSGVTLDATSNCALATSLRKFASTCTDTWSVRIARSMVARALTEAQYCSRDSIVSAHDTTNAVIDYTHFGLAESFYTHFTSPIRRYADIIVHRLLLASLNTTHNINTHIKLPCGSELCSTISHLNDCHRIAKCAQRDSCDLFWSLYINNVSVLFTEAIITGVNSSGCSLLLPQYSHQTRVHLVDRNGLLNVCSSTQQQQQHTVSCRVQIDDMKSRLWLHVDGRDSVQLQLFDRLRVRICSQRFMHDATKATTQYRIAQPCVCVIWNAGDATPKLTKWQTNQPNINVAQLVAETQTSKLCATKATPRSAVTQDPARHRTVYGICRKHVHNECGSNSHEDVKRVVAPHTPRWQRTCRAGRIRWGTVIDQ